MRQINSTLLLLLMIIYLPIYCFSQETEVEEEEDVEATVENLEIEEIPKDYGNVLDIDIKNEENSISLTWLMANSDFGELLKLEKTYNHKHWNTIETKEYNKKKLNAKYSFSDRKTENPYYRLVQYNNDSSLVFYGPFSINDNKEEMFKVTISSEKLKVNEQLRINLNKHYEFFTVMLFNHKGKVLYHKRVYDSSEVIIDITRKFARKNLSLYIKTDKDKSLINIDVL